MKKWQYDFRKIKSDSLINMVHLNELGNEGWEMIGVVALPAANIYYFKREKVEKALPDNGD